MNHFNLYNISFGVVLVQFLLMPQWPVVFALLIMTLNHAYKQYLDHQLIKSTKNIEIEINNSLKTTTEKISDLESRVTALTINGFKQR